MKLLETFEASHNLPVVEFAKLVGKSRRWISYEIRDRKLLALSMGNRGQRIPDWHLDPLKHNLIQTLLKKAKDVDEWQILSIDGAWGERNREEAGVATATLLIAPAAETLIGSEVSNRL